MNYIKKYLKHHDIGEQDIILCKVCSRVSSDVHHILFKSAGGTDDIDNLIALCRECHNKAHSGGISREFLKSRLCL